MSGLTVEPISAMAKSSIRLPVFRDKAWTQDPEGYSGFFAGRVAAAAGLCQRCGVKWFALDPLNNTVTEPFAHVLRACHDFNIETSPSETSGVNTLIFPPAWTGSG